MMPFQFQLFGSRQFFLLLVDSLEWLVINFRLIRRSKMYSTMMHILWRVDVKDLKNPKRKAEISTLS